ncbi:hypothetical protein [Pseudorhodoferax sp. Leaf267]|uniref:hypothetical protein n=1 Tax=Pseudorhodoferax sp. Leaf267 TaxID=1736316 RepID=UPI00071251BD|nr:hypothetical protein [Pseudorhodoferax sp. Leaf267]KQP22414.1 hypothetical protein ASF43_00320 [Pseudorhodoferax sp. Leaf267]
MRRSACAVRALAGACALALAGCAFGPPATDAPTVTQSALGPPVSRADGLAGFEAEQRMRVVVLEHQERWAEAAWAWEVLNVLRPGHAAYRNGAAMLQRRIDASVAEQLEQAATAQQRGALDVASTHYLRALAMQPDQAKAADALRAIERERNRRNYLGKPSRLTILRRGGVEAMPPRTPAVPKVGTAGAATKRADPEAP